MTSSSEQFEQLRFDLPKTLHETPYKPSRQDILDICADEVLKMYCSDVSDFDERREVNQEHGYKKIVIHNKLYNQELSPDTIRIIARGDLHYLETIEQPLHDECDGEIIVSLVPRITLPRNGHKKLPLMPNNEPGQFTRRAK